RYLPVPAASEDGEGTVGGLREAWAAVRDDDVFRRLLVASFLFGTGCWIQTPAHPLLLVDVLHVSTAQVGVFAAAAAAATLGVGAVYLAALALMTAAAWLVVREPARRAVVYSRS